ncbi:MAG: FadR/GntR family transcriptional regulator [Bacillota bacterium]|nr:FadR/GntR family transcriptional regulator [Bacillota bacterium]
MLNPIKSTKIYEKVMEEIKDLVKKGDLKKGDKLPSERDLSEQLQVSRTSVREALRILEMFGFIEVRHGEGNFINDNLENSFLEPLSVIFLLLGSKSEEVLELRKIIEPETAALAAKNITNEQLIDLRKIEHELSNTEDNEIRISLDKRFHYKIAEASQNLLISTMMFSISSLIENYIENSKVHTFNKIKIDIQHKEILKALEIHDSFAAASAVKKHLEFIS